MTPHDNYLTLYDMALIRSAGLRGFRSTVAELGGDADRYAAALDVPAAALDTDDLLVSDWSVAALLERAATDLHCSDLGLRIARRQDLGMLGPLALVIQNSPTIADALECTSRYLFVHGESLSVSLEEDPLGVRGVSALRYGSTEGLPAPVQGTDLGLGFIHRAIVSLTGGPYGLRSVELPYVPAASLEVYEAYFGAPVNTGGAAARLRLPTSLLRTSLDGADPHLRQLVLAFMLQQATNSESDDVAPRVRSTVTCSLGTTVPDVSSVAHVLALHPRTLQRRLAAEGTSFGSILDECRRNAARRYLAGTDLPFGQVASLLGLSEQSALTRCCRRWWGLTPTAVRRGRATKEAAF